MDQTTQSGRRRFLAQGGAVALACAGLHAVLAPAGSAGAAHQGDDQAAQNLANFDRLDYEAWNGPDWDLFRQLHTDDVHVSGGGATTDGIDVHLAWGQAFTAQVPDAKIVAHPIRIGAGDWTAVTGLLSDGSITATFARWEDGQIAEEYLFSLMGAAGDAGSGTPMS